VDSTLRGPVSLGLTASWRGRPSSEDRTRSAVSATVDKTDSYAWRPRRSGTCAGQRPGDTKSPFCDGGSQAEGPNCRGIVPGEAVETELLLINGEGFRNRSSGLPGSPLPESLYLRD
jgi:hypothetical protein